MARYLSRFDPEHFKRREIESIRINICTATLSWQRNAPKENTPTKYSRLARKDVHPILDTTTSQGKGGWEVLLPRTLAMATLLEKIAQRCASSKFPSAPQMPTPTPEYDVVVLVKTLLLEAVHAAKPEVFMVTPVEEHALRASCHQQEENNQNLNGVEIKRKNIVKIEKAEIRKISESGKMKQTK